MTRAGLVVGDPAGVATADALKNAFALARTLGGA